MNYFAHGSNMALNRLAARTPSAHFVGVFILIEHDLRFHKAGRDGSAKCDAFHTGLSMDYVEGVVFDIDSNEIIALDKVEGLGNGYAKKYVTVVNSAGHQLDAFTYVATNIDDSLHPFSWYKKHVLEGARAAGLSTSYIAKIEGVESIKDLNQQREYRELAIHEQ